MEIDNLLATALRQSGQTLALAESCTGGMIAARITTLPGSSAYFSGGVVAYSNGVKTALLQVPEELLVRHGAVSGEVAKAMADGARLVIGSDLALSVTGIAGPDGGTIEKPVGTVFVALSGSDTCIVQHHLFHGDRATIRQQATEQALFLLKNHLLGVKSAVN